MQAQLNGLYKRQGLSQHELEQIEQLAQVCNDFEGLDLKLNWNVLRTRSGKAIDDFLYYADGILVGYLALFAFNSKEAEIGAMVHPDYRRRGVFSRLLQEARSEVARRGIPDILLVVEAASKSGQAFITSLPVRYDHSEYKMELQGEPVQNVFHQRLHFREAQAGDVRDLAHITALAFDIPEEEVQWYTSERLQTPDRHFYVGEVDGKVIGKLDVNLDEQTGFIYGFGVLPEYRGQGYGREILARTIQEIKNTGRRKIVLEVATDNPHALGLYHSCGFRETGSYEYYRYSVQ